MHVRTHTHRHTQTLGVHPCKPMMHIAYSPYIRKVYKLSLLFSLLFSFNLLFCLIYVFGLPPILTVTLYTYWTPLHRLSHTPTHKNSPHPHTPPHITHTYTYM